VVGLQQLAQWRTQISEEPSSFARDLAMVLLIELERLQREATDALQVAERLRSAGTTREARSTLV